MGSRTRNRTRRAESPQPFHRRLLWSLLPTTPSRLVVALCLFLLVGATGCEEQNPPPIVQPANSAAGTPPASQALHPLCVVNPYDFPLTVKDEAGSRQWSVAAFGMLRIELPAGRHNLWVEGGGQNPVARFTFGRDQHAVWDLRGDGRFEKVRLVPGRPGGRILESRVGLESSAGVILFTGGLDLLSAGPLPRLNVAMDPVEKVFSAIDLPMPPQPGATVIGPAPETPPTGLLIRALTDDAAAYRAETRGNALRWLSRAEPLPEVYWQVTRAALTSPETFLREAAVATLQQRTRFPEGFVAGLKETLVDSAAAWDRHGWGGPISGALAGAIAIAGTINDVDDILAEAPERRRRTIQRGFTDVICPTTAAWYRARLRGGDERARNEAMTWLQQNEALALPGVYGGLMAEAVEMAGTPSGPGGTFPAGHPANTLVQNAQRILEQLPPATARQVALDALRVYAPTVWQTGITYLVRIAGERGIRDLHAVFPTLHPDIRRDAVARVVLDAEELTPAVKTFLLDALRDEVWNVSRFAFGRLCEPTALNDPQIVAALEAVLDRLERENDLQGLLILREAYDLARYRWLLDRPERERREGLIALALNGHVEAGYRAVSWLRQQGGEAWPDILARLIERMATAPAENRAMLLFALAHEREEEAAVAWVRSYLSDPSPDVRMVAFALLCRDAEWFQGEAVQRALSAAVLAQGDPEQRARLEDLLQRARVLQAGAGSGDDPEGLQFLCDALVTGDGEEQAFVIEMFAGLRIPAACEVLIEVYPHLQGPARERALDLIAGYPALNANAQSLYESACGAEDAAVRERAFHALVRRAEEHPDEAWVRSLLRVTAAREADTERQWRFQQALQRIGIAGE